MLLKLYTHLHTSVVLFYDVSIEDTVRLTWYPRRPDLSIKY
jgi:hypothetical protein